MDNKYAKVDGEAHGASTQQQDLQQLRNAESRRNAFLWGQTHEPTVQYQMLSSENIHITLHRLNPVIFRDICMYSTKRGCGFKRIKEGYRDEIIGRNRKGKMM